MNITKASSGSFLVVYFRMSNFAVNSVVTLTSTKAIDGATTLTDH